MLLGDDETKPIHRLALICEHCRLVNGQAPPGVKDLSELGRWRCGGCKAWNGEVSEVKKLLAEAGDAGAGQKDGDAGEESVATAHEPIEETPARSTRSRTARAAAED